jgi:single-stranded-DNA-specific exonuclease
VDLGAIIRAARAEGILETGGGHAMAAGFSLRRSRLGLFDEFLAARIGPQSAAISKASDLVVDALVSASGANHALLDDLDRAGPYGQGHPEPTFVLPDMLVVYAGVVGTNHVRLRLVGRDGQGLGAIAFRAGGTALGDALLKARSTRIHVAGKIKRDEYEGEMRVQLHVEDAAPSEA